MAVVAANRVQVAAQAVRVGQARAEAERSEPTIELVRDGEVVRAMDITCSCGEHIIVRCDYD